jgi:hypothetical protein
VAPEGDLPDVCGNYKVTTRIMLRPGYHEIWAALVTAGGYARERLGHAFVHVDPHEPVAHLEALEQDFAIKAERKGAEWKEEHARAQHSGEKVAEVYAPHILHHDLYNFTTIEWMLADWIHLMHKRILNGTVTETVAANVEKIVDSGIFKFKLFSPEFCRKLVEEVQNFQRLKLNNTETHSMKGHGALLLEMGLGRLLNFLSASYINVIGRVLFPFWGPYYIDSNHGFVVQYRLGESVSLDRHTDHSEITLNAALGLEWEGGALSFHGVRDAASEVSENALVNLKPGEAILHLGQHWHQALPLENGERYNLVIWYKSRVHRGSAHEKFRNFCPKPISHSHPEHWTKKRRPRLDL